MNFMLQGINIPLSQFQRRSYVLENIKIKGVIWKDGERWWISEIRTRAKKIVAECDYLVEKGVRNVIKHKAIILPQASVPLKWYWKFFVPAAREHLSWFAAVIWTWMCARDIGLNTTRHTIASFLEFSGSQGNICKGWSWSNKEKGKT